MSESDPTTPAETPAPAADTTPPAAPVFAPPSPRLATTPPSAATTPASAASNAPSTAPAAPSGAAASAAPPTAPSGATAFGTTASAFSSSPAKPTASRSRALPIVAALAAGAVLGGASGAGISAWAIAANRSATEQSVSTPQTITVNDPDSVNVVNAVAAKAGPSVVTIAASSSSAAGSGSGVILSSDGYVLTNNHVVTLDGATSDATIEVTTADGRIFSAEIVGNDPIVDLAVIKLTDASGLTPIEFGDVDSLDVGDRVVAIGAPLGLSNTVTDGIVSAVDRSIQIASSAVPDDGTDDGSGEDPFSFDLPGQQSGGGSGVISIPVIQTDAAINPGNSGGALVDDEGRLVGINVAIANAGGSSTTAGNIGVGFAVPADVAQRVAEELIENGTATHGLLGATVRDASSSDGSIVGAYVREVTSGGAAEVAGMRAGDIVTEFDGHPISGSVDLTAQVRRLAAGETVDLVYVRNGSEQTVTVTLGELE